MKFRRLMMGLLVILLAGCTSISTIEPGSGGEAAATTLPVTVEVLTFEGGGDTFLSAIESLIAERGEPDRHLRVEETMADGTVWQGESLQYDGTSDGDVQVVMLQQAQAGADTGLRLEGAIDADIGAMLWPIRICRWHSRSIPPILPSSLCGRGRGERGMVV